MSMPTSWARASAVDKARKMTLEEIKQQFRQYLLGIGRTENTVSAYISGVNNISHHYGHDVFRIRETDKLDQLLTEYGTGGQYKDIGGQNSGNTCSGIREWVAFNKTMQHDHPSAYFSVILTDGAIRNGYIMVSHQFNFFPSAFIANEDGISPRKFTLCWPDGEEVQTCVLGKYKRIQARFNAHFAHFQAPKTLYISQDPEVADRYLVTEQPPLGVSIAPQTNPAVPNCETNKQTMPLNQILYGPPGTGKTYHTINEALRILNPAFLEANLDNRQALKTEFDRLLDAKRIRFVTFHQSFSYEDFVEGLRANTSEETGQINYEVEDGIFKLLCDAAGARISRPAATSVVTTTPIDLTGRHIWKMSLGNTQNSEASIYNDCIENNYALLGYGNNVDFSGCDEREQVLQHFIDNKIPVANPKNDYGVTSVTTFKSRIRIGDLLVISDGNFKFRAIGEVTGDYQYRPNEDFPDDYSQMRPVRWLRTYEPSLAYDELLNNRFSQMTLYKFGPGTIDLKKLQTLLNDDLPAVEPASDGPESSTQPNDARVLIIDEINRGNTSRIFGELITLIEPSKRAGADEQLQVTLPYSKKPFKVPGNVYLIGTMNTADRSLAGLDIALRRRFTFKEMPPRPDLLDDVQVEGVDIGAMLRIMNQRISVLLDHDHCLGHAYFMPLKKNGANTLEHLASIFLQNIIPLLQEYFFEDWERIRWVLNDQNKPVEDAFLIEDKALMPVALFPNVHDRLRQTTAWRLNHQATMRPAAYRGIITAQVETAVAASGAADY